MTMKFTTSECVTLMKHVRTAADVQDGLTCSRAYDIANQALEKLFHERHPSPPPAKPKEEKVTPRVPCTVHRERSFKFADGTVMEACTHHECLFGKGTKRHSDGAQAGLLYAIEIPDAIEMDDSSPDGTKELSVEEWAGAEPTMTEDGDELEALLELDEDEDELCQPS
jgi:hypothetical protein